jgi:hypothetical protein
MAAESSQYQDELEIYQMTQTQSISVMAYMYSNAHPLGIGSVSETNVFVCIVCS